MTVARSTALLTAVAAVYLALAWPGAGERGVIAEEITPYLPRHPVVLASADLGGVRLLPPHDEPDRRGWVSTAQWPNLAYVGDERTWPVLIKGHQSALGTYLGLAAAPALGDGIAGVRRSSVLLGLALVSLVFALARRLGLGLALAAASALACALSPGLLFFSRTGYGFELASRVAMLAALVLAAPARPLTRRRAVALGLVLAAAILCRATIAATLLPALLLLLLPRTSAGVPPRGATRPDPGTPQPITSSDPPDSAPARPSAAGSHAPSSSPARSAWRSALRARLVELRRPALALGLGLALPVLFVLALQAVVPLHAGTAPAAKLPLDELSQRTATAPATLAAQLAWVADPRSVLLPLVADRSVASGLALSFGAAIFLLALARWWRARAGDGECMFVAAAVGNALFGAWLYGDPQQFQLGMALEPLLVLAVAHQLQSWQSSPRLVLAFAVGLLGARAWQCGDLLRAEAAATNPMLSGKAQRALAEALAARGPEAGAVVTTTYNHVGMLEAWSAPDAAPPIHAYRALRRGRGDDASARTTAAWRAILQAYPVRFVVLSTGPNLFDGPFTDNTAAERALLTALADSGRQLLARHEFTCESGTSCLALLELSP